MVKEGNCWDIGHGGFCTCLGSGLKFCEGVSRIGDAGLICLAMVEFKFVVLHAIKN